MRSIRVFLVAGLLAILTLMIFLSALHGYRTSMAEAQALFDKTLADTARLLASVEASGEGTGDFIVKTDQYVFQIGRDGKLWRQSENAPATALVESGGGYQDSNFDGYRWRTYSLHDTENDRWIVLAERADIRYALAERIILESVIPIVFSLPLGGVVIWWFVTRSLAPLRDLADQLGSKRANDLSPLRLRDQPAELTQVVVSTNQLLRRLKASFEREKHFTADAAHELRTPISAIGVHLYNLASELPADDHNIQQLKVAVERMSHLVEQILKLHRTAPDEYLLELQPVDLFAVAQSVVVDKYPRCVEKQQQIELLGENCVIDGEPFTLETLVQNLLGNAIKYTPVGGRIRIKVTSGKGFAQLEVEDSGRGIPEEQYQRIFDRFYRVDGDRHKTQVTGCGLGLSIVKHIVELHDAQILLDRSSFATGLSVKVRFPVASS